MKQEDYDKLATAQPIFTKVCEDVEKLMPIRVLWGKRSGSIQRRLFLDKRTRLDYPPGGKHNTEPLSQAIDITPLPYDDKDTARLDYMAGLFRMAAFMRGYKIRWGGDWDSDGEVKDNKFNDLFHFEIR